MLPNTCECGKPADVRISVTKIDGTLLDSSGFCARCFNSGVLQRSLVNLDLEPGTVEE